MHTFAEYTHWKSVAAIHVASLEVKPNGKRYVAAEEIWQKIGLTKEQRDHSGKMLLTRIMRELGFRRSHPKDLRHKSNKYTYISE